MQKHWDCWWKCKWYNYFGKSLLTYYKIKQYSTYDPVIPLLGIYQGEIKTYVCKKELYMDIHNSCIHDRENWKQLKYPATSEWINKLCCIAYSKARQKNLHHMDEHQKLYTEQNKQDTKEYVLYDSTYRKF